MIRLLSIISLEITKNVKYVCLLMLNDTQLSFCLSCAIPYSLSPWLIVYLWRVSLQYTFAEAFDPKNTLKAIMYRDMRAGCHYESKLLFVLLTFPSFPHCHLHAVACVEKLISSCFGVMWDLSDYAFEMLTHTYCFGCCTSKHIYMCKCIYFV